MIPKFRAWDKASHAWRHDIYIGLDGLAKDLSRAGEEPFELPLDNVILMQSTGLFDNSTPKKEIFESDIVEWEHKDTGQLVRGIVKYDTELGFWGMTDVRFNDLTAIGYLANQRVTVLGNIYENKDLVEENK